MTKEAAFVTLYTVLVTLSKVIAPFVPFMAEEMYQNLVRQRGPHRARKRAPVRFPHRG